MKALVVVGLPNARARLAELVQVTNGFGVTRALMAGALIVQNSAKERAPFLTGNLRRSIHSEVQDPMHVVVGTDVEYAPYLEFGTSRMPARPYLRPAFDEEKDRVIATVEGVLRAEIAWVTL